jgi:hypothetical protein
MGRPAKFYIRIHISLSNEQLEEIDHISGSKGRSAAMREAADQWIAAQKEKGIPSVRKTNAGKLSG